ncbi:TPA: hypothetical protein DCW61_04370 [Candidatus Uhrbacteria bacterium]|nr:hypothetical protein [Candidatus Uhrbacteria bacterium]
MIQTHQEYQAPIASRLLHEKNPEPAIAAFQHSYEAFKTSVLTDLSGKPADFACMRPVQWNALVERVLHLNTLFPMKETVPVPNEVPSFGIELEFAPFDQHPGPAVQRAQEGSSVNLLG